MKLMQIPLGSISNKRRRYHDSLTEQQSIELRLIYNDFGRFAGDATFEEFERDFLFERNVDAEIRQWSRMTKAFRRCMKRFPTTDKAAATAVVISLSLGVSRRFPGVSFKAFRFLRKHVPVKPLQVVWR